MGFLFFCQRSLCLGKIPVLVFLLVQNLCRVHFCCCWYFLYDGLSVDGAGGFLADEMYCDNLIQIDGLVQSINVFFLYVAVLPYLPRYGKEPILGWRKFHQERGFLT